jgi:ribosomal subunit interface protein
MQIQVHYQGLESTPWMNEFITQRVLKLERFLNPSSTVQVHLRYDNKVYTTSLSVHHFHQDYAFTSPGENLYESFTASIDKASRTLGEHKKRIKDKVHRKLFVINRNLAEA